MQMRRVVPEWSGFDAPEHMVHLSSLPERLPGVDDPLPPLVDPSEWLTFKTDKRRREHLGGRLLLANDENANVVLASSGELKSPTLALLHLPVQ